MKDYKALLERLKAAQFALLTVAAKSRTLPSDKALAKIADLELSIAAIENALDPK